MFAVGHLRIGGSRETLIGAPAPADPAPSRSRRRFAAPAAARRCRVSSRSPPAPPAPSSTWGPSRSSLPRSATSSSAWPRAEPRSPATSSSASRSWAPPTATELVTPCGRAPAPGGRRRAGASRSPPLPAASSRAATNTAATATSPPSSWPTALREAPPSRAVHAGSVLGAGLVSRAVRAPRPHEIPLLGEIAREPRASRPMSAAAADRRRFAAASRRALGVELGPHWPAGPPPPPGPRARRTVSTRGGASAVELVRFEVAATALGTSQPELRQRVGRDLSLANPA